jgi:hypothetical protein
MPIIKFSAADALQTTIVPANIYPSEISNITGPTRSSSGKSNNFFVDVMINDGKYKGKTRTIAFSSGSNAVTMLGDMQFFPTQHFLMLDSAITGREIVPEEYMLDTDKLLHKPFEVSWGVTSVDGHLVNTINSFHPKGYGQEAPAF